MPKDSDPFPVDYFDRHPFSPQPLPPRRRLPLIVRQGFFSVLVGLGIGLGVLFFDGKAGNFFLMFPFTQNVHRGDPH